VLHLDRDGRLSQGPAQATGGSKAVRNILTVLALLALVGGLGAVKGAQIGKLIGIGKQLEKDGPPPEAVSSAPAEDQSWEGTITAIGNVASDKGVVLSTDAPGVVTRVYFESGATVKRGQLLVELDSSVERAQLANAVARRSLASTTRDRTRALAASGAVSAAQLDADESQKRTTTTDVAAIQAEIAKKRIRAPFAGKLGIRQVNVGQYLSPGAPVTVLETMEAVHVDFTLPQQRLLQLTLGLPVRVSLDGVPGPPFEGKIAAVDPTIDSTTRTIKVRADVPGDADKLRAGMFVNVSVILPQKGSFITVPATAVVHAPYGDSAFVIEDRKPGAPGPAATPDGKPIKTARQQFVRVGVARGDFIAIVDGLKAGEEVVTAGAFKLHNGSAVFVDNTKPLTPQLSPRPENR
jgi:membrane fusion protein (multidrug efflux system)